MTDQDTYATFSERFAVQAGRIALRLFGGTVHAYPMRGFQKHGMTVPIGFPMCGADIRFMAATAMVTAEIPTCELCLAAMRKGLGRR
jgi:hypothetical protein